MTRVELTELARQDLAFLIRTRELPEELTHVRVEKVVGQLELFPELGQAIAGRYPGARSVLVAWDWFSLLYHFFEADDHVVGISFFDSRTHDAPLP